MSKAVRYKVCLCPDWGYVNKCPPVDRGLNSVPLDVQPAERAVRENMVEYVSMAFIGQFEDSV